MVIVRPDLFGADGKDAPVLGTVGPFDTNHVGTEAREELGTPRAGDVTAKVNDEYTGECSHGLTVMGSVRTTVTVVVRVTKRRAPTRRVEQELWEAGHEIVVGIDEVGRGAWAGPIMVGAAVLPRDKRVNGVRDSKLLTERERERLFDRVGQWCDTWAVGASSQVECDELGMAEAQRLATRRALQALNVKPDAAVVDGKWDFVGDQVPHIHRMVKADAFCLSVAAASILAKVTRDRLMRELSLEFPAWSFDSNKGYPCPLHKAALHAYGPSGVHRRSWVFMDALVWPGLRVHRPEQPTLF